MASLPPIDTLSLATAAILGSPFAWCHVTGGFVTLANAVATGGTPGGTYQLPAFAIAKYPITNAQYQQFLSDPVGYALPEWWTYSAAALQWRHDHPHPRPTAFDGSDLPRTRVSWFDAMAFCKWLAAKLQVLPGIQPSGAGVGSEYPAWTVRLPTEQEWQRAALGDAGWEYPWGNELNPTRSNYGRSVGYPTSVGRYPNGQSPYGALDMVGNVWEWCVTGWGEQEVDIGGYTYRVIRGGAWNVRNPEHLRASDRGGNSPRGQLNDGGFRCAYYYQVESGPPIGCKVKRESRAFLDEFSARFVAGGERAPRQGPVAPLRLWLRRRLRNSSTSCPCFSLGSDTTGPPHRVKAARGPGSIDARSASFSRPIARSSWP
jgi:formylglycine-generating enzyme required for sulfatase activity